MFRKVPVFVCSNVSECRVDCVWPTAVDRRHAEMLITLAKALHASFDIVDRPRPIWCDPAYEEERKKRGRKITHLAQSQEKSTNNKKRGQYDEDHSQKGKKTQKENTKKKKKDQNALPKAEPPSSTSESDDSATSERHRSQSEPPPKQIKRLGDLDK